MPDDFWQPRHAHRTPRGRVAACPVHPFRGAQGGSLADGAAIHYTYDAEHRVATIRDENHTEPNTAYAYDPAGRLETVTQTLADAPTGFITTHYAYDIHGNLTAVTDPNGNVTTYVYDDFGQMTSLVSPVTGTTTYQYDAAGNLLQTTDANGAVTTRLHDALDRVLSGTSILGSNTEIVSWTYDDITANRFAVGRQASMTDPSGSTQYHYERRGLLREESRTLTGAQYSYTTGFGYDVDGNRAVIDYPSTQLTVTYGFDYAGRPTSASGVVSSVSYLPFGPLTSIEFASGLLQAMTYDSRYRMMSNGLYSPGPDPRLGLVMYTYGYDAVGNIRRISDEHDRSYSRTFRYDDLNRLTVANTGSSLWGRGRYTWDAMGNMTSMKLGEIAEGPTDPLDEARDRRQRPRTEENVPLGRSLSFTYTETATGTMPRLLEVTTNDLTRPVAYDAAGNEIAYAVTRSYSPRNLLATVTDPGEPDDPLKHTIAYSYDGRGVRVIRAESPVDGPGTTAHRFSIYTPELQLMAVTRDDATNVWTTSSAQDKDIHYEIVWFAGRPVAQITPGSSPQYTFTDHLGTPIFRTGLPGIEHWRAEYEPFGNVWEMRSGNRLDQPLRFPWQEVAMSWEGQEENYNIFRWYRSGWGRYTQTDPIGVMEFRNPPQRGSHKHEPTHNHLYGYAGSNPLLFKDPLGLKKCKSGNCDNCPSGYWTVTEAAFGAFAIYGKKWGTATYRCLGSPRTCRFGFSCEAVGGGSEIVIFGISGGYIGGSDCKCDEDLSGQFDSVEISASGGSVTGTIGPGGCKGVALGAGVGPGATLKGSKCYYQPLGCQ